MADITPIITYFVFFFFLLMLGTISGIFSERAGIVNIAINGFMIFGAVMYLAFSVLITDVIFPNSPEVYKSAYWQIPLTILSVLATMVFSLLFGFATIKLKAEQTISGFAINVFAAGIASILILILTKLQNSGTFVQLRRNELALNPSFSNYGNILSFKTVVSVVTIFAAWFALRKTKWGLRFRAIGENPQAADVAGINVNKIKWEAILLAGGIAGLAGSFYAVVNPDSLSTTKEVNGYGYLALAIMITSRWRISISIFVSILFSSLMSLSYYGVNLMNAGKYGDLIKAIPYVVTLLIMVFTSKTNVGPAAAGVPYDKSKR
ncbi:ABC transporter permease [Mycoplasma seminis]|uniref:ABC transporter permease n=1 Tax=Mycoplasma seminis TaxID=512749 RepID=A0ABY9HAM2_9MOLU|nr:ABC transporter permease [Mycoplasma seminis]WLP85642.1 ABC transporter permease [Mycoplasma seminis]